ncbi:MAG: protein translocase subunit SecD [Candidatus Buchananbacteria bacterium]
MQSEQNKIRLALAGVITLAILAILIDFPGQLTKTGFPVPSFLNLSYRLGLDLQGGTQLIYEADLSKIPSTEQATAVEGVRDVIERRVNSFGVAEPLVQTSKVANNYRIIAELAGISDINQAIKMIGETPLLEFKEQNPNQQITITEAQKKEMDASNATIENTAKTVLNEALKFGSDFGALATKYSEDPGSKDNSGSLGFVKKGLLDPSFEQVCFNELKNGEIANKLTKTAYGYHIIKKIDEHGSGDSREVNCSHILLKTKSEKDYGQAVDPWLYTGLTGKQLVKAQIAFDPNTQIPQISLEFNDEGKDLFAAITTRNIGKPVAIFLDGSAISTPTVQDAIKDGKAVINGKFTIQEAKLLAQRLNAGALPVPINLISQKTVGASLGNESVNQSLKAGIFSLILICLFMILYYRLPGITASIALLFYGLVVLAIFKILNVTLTLSGIAGFVLSLGMAVDANVLIFERFKEEIRWGKPFSLAIDEGFKRAWSSIFDGHVSTLISCAILMWFTTSMVKGFAITLAIGTLMSLFSAVVVTRLIVKFITRIKFFNHLWLYGVRKKQVKN